MNNPELHTDQAFMALAIKLAENGRFTTTPNPNVGCVIVSEGKVVGQGWHHRAGQPHAEVNALQQAGEKAKGATAYVTLEPCSHHGKTPPCANALISAGVKKVVAAMQDPNPLVAGNGLARLKDAGITVQCGVLREQAEALNPGFIKRMATGLPFVTLKLAASLDGKTALKNGKSQWITGPQARQDVQYYRAQSCAIVTGSGTVLADNPSLNVRYESSEQLSQLVAQQHRRQPLRVILDGRNRLTPDNQIFSLEGEVLLINQQHNPLAFAEQVKQWQVPVTDGKLDLVAILKYLAEIGMNQVWVEAGATLSGAFLQQNLVDQLILYQAPKLLGHQARDLCDMPELTSLQQAIEFEWQDITQIGQDLKLTAKRISTGINEK